MREAPADGAAVAHLVMRHVAHGFDQQRMRRPEPCIVLDVAPARACSESKAAGFDRDVIESLKMAQVYQQSRLSEPEGHRGQQALPAGDHLGLAPATGEQLHDFSGSRWRSIFEVR